MGVEGMARCDGAPGLGDDAPARFGVRGEAENVGTRLGADEGGNTVSHEGARVGEEFRRRGNTLTDESSTEVVGNELNRLGLGVGAGLFSLRMELECPVCQALNLPEGELCSRCGCDLGVLWEIQQLAAEHLSQAGESLERGDARGGFSHALRSWEMFHSAQSAAAAALASAILGEMATVEVWMHQLRVIKASSPSIVEVEVSQ